MRAKVSSWERISSRSLIPQAKASGQYLNSVLAKIESVKAGYDEAILLDEHGHVCEGSGENIYVVRDGVILTPPQTASILDGINRRSVIQIARDLGYEVIERDIARAELYLADEVFLTGTAAELVPVREIDEHAIGTGAPGRDHARSCRRAFQDALNGRSERYREWLDVVAIAERAGRMSARGPSCAARITRRGRLARRLVGARLPQSASARHDPLERTTAVNTIQLYDATLRDGMQGEGMSLSAEEKLRVAHRLDELGIELIEAGFPASNPKERELFELLAGERFRQAQIAAFGMTRRRGVAAERDAALTLLARVASRRSARSSARPGRCTSRSSSRSTATRTCG